MPRIWSPRASTVNSWCPTPAYEEAFIEAAGAGNLNDRCYVTFSGLPLDRQGEAGQRFVERYQARYGRLPEGYAIYGYEAAKVALAAIERAGSRDRAAIVAACLAIQDFDQGALGTWSFDANGDTTITTVSGNIVKDGEFRFAKLLGE